MLYSKVRLKEVNQTISVDSFDPSYSLHLPVLPCLCSPSQRHWHRSWQGRMLLPWLLKTRKIPVMLPVLPPSHSPLRHSLGTGVVISGYSSTRIQRKRYQRIFTHLPTNIFVFFLTGKRKWLIKRRNFNTDKKQMKRPAAHLSTVILHARWYLIDLPIINGPVIY